MASLERKCEGDGIIPKETPTHEPSKEPYIKSHKITLFFTFINLIIFFVYIFPTLTFFACPWIRRNLIFMNYVNFRKNNFSAPDFECAHNFYLESENSVQVGVWHIEPIGAKCAGFSSTNDQTPVVLYLHGSGGTRASRHRQDLYHVLSGPRVRAHVVALDYRGFGDSTNVAVSADGVETDSLAVFQWLTSHVGAKRIYVWGHSLGTGVATRLVVHLPASYRPRGLILEAPFTSMAEAVANHPLTSLYRNLPLFDYFFVEPVKQSDINFDNEAALAKIDLPLMILHAEDDDILDINFSKILVEKAKSPFVDFVHYNASHHYGHMFIFKDPDLPETVMNFFHRTLNQSLSNI